MILKFQQSVVCVNQTAISVPIVIHISMVWMMLMHSIIIFVNHCIHGILLLTRVASIKICNWNTSQINKAIFFFKFNFLNHSTLLTLKIFISFQSRLNQSWLIGPALFHQSYPEHIRANFLFYTWIFKHLPLNIWQTKFTVNIITQNRHFSINSFYKWCYILYFDTVNSRVI